MSYAFLLKYYSTSHSACVKFKAIIIISDTTHIVFYVTCANGYTIDMNFALWIGIQL